MTDYLLLKWGTLKGYDVECQAAKLALQAYFDLGEQSMSRVMQQDTLQQKQLLCTVVDVVDIITNDHTGNDMTKEEAKKYIMEYGQ